ncbi:hypothetical protein ASG84_06205 [Rhodococcus sp. Leaf278]|nr:hypothetical protein ASG84_06205 [Rhodococcus sp. Leaf278]
MTTGRNASRVRPVTDLVRAQTIRREVRLSIATKRESVPKLRRSRILPVQRNDRVQLRARS